jgi:hypothetical protein
MRERDHRCMCTERAIAARDDRCTQSVVSFPWSGAVGMPVWKDVVVSVPLRALMSDETEACDGPAHDG